MFQCSQAMKFCKFFKDTFKTCPQAKIQMRCHLRCQVFLPSSLLCLCPTRSQYKHLSAYMAQGRFEHGCVFTHIQQCGMASLRQCVRVSVQQLTVIQSQNQPDYLSQENLIFVTKHGQESLCYIVGGLLTDIVKC